MKNIWQPSALCFGTLFLAMVAATGQSISQQIGREVAVPAHLQDGEEFTTSLRNLIEYGSQLFNAKFTIQEGAGRPLSKGTGAAISDLSSTAGVSEKFRPNLCA